MTKADVLLSIAVPVYNEADGLTRFNKTLRHYADKASGGSYEIIYCNDGSYDNTADLIKSFHHQDKRIKLVSLPRNFGKEIAATAALHFAKGKAMITIDADGQHPVELIPEFVASWRAGAKVVIGIRQSNQDEGLVKRYGSKLFYRTFNRFTGFKLIPGTSDYRLIDQTVCQEFVKMTERSRITRGLIEWLGYPKQYIKFDANPRLSGQAGYSYKKLVKLFVDSVVSMSKSPLYISAYLGALVLPISILTGLVMLVDAVLGDPLKFNAKGSAYVVVVLLFLVGVLLVSQGIIGFYLSHIHTETQNRPLYVVDAESSIGL